MKKTVNHCKDCPLATYVDGKKTEEYYCNVLNECVILVHVSEPFGAEDMPIPANCPLFAGDITISLNPAIEKQIDEDDEFDALCDEADRWVKRNIENQ